MSSIDRRARRTGRRQTDRDRPLRAHGPFIRTLIGLQALTAVAAVVSLVWVIVSFSGTVDNASERVAVNAAKIAAIQSSRSGASYDSCRLLQKLVYSAATRKGGSLARAGAVGFLKQNDIYDCHKYVRDQTRLHVKMPARTSLVLPRIGALTAPRGL